MAEKKKSKTELWQEAASRASAALQELLDMQSDYQDKLDNMPENLQSSAYGEKLQTVCDLDLQSAFDVVDEAEGIDLPLGFGRD